MPSVFLLCTQKGEIRSKSTWSRNVACTKYRTMRSPKRFIVSFILLLLASFISCTHGFNINPKRPDPEELALEIVQAEAEVVAEQSALMGKLFPIFSQLFVRRGKSKYSFHQVFKAVTDLVDEREFAIFATIGWGLVPVTQAVYELYANVTGHYLADLEAAEDVPNDDTKKFSTRANMKEVYDGITQKMRQEEVAEQKSKRMKPFQKTFLYQIQDHVSQASKIGISVVTVDIISLICRMFGYNPYGIFSQPVEKIFSKVAYTVWIALRLKIWKRHLLKNALGRESDLGKLKVFDNLSDGVLYLIWMFYTLNYLEVEAGIAVKSIFSVGATSTLVFGLASKDIATQLISGLTLHLSDKMFEGDDVRFHDGTSGKIQNMGWFETMIRNSDEVVVGVPNTQLSGQRVYNLSRTPRSQVKQELRVSYDDAAKIPKLLESIKEEIKEDCPKLITDGSRPFRAHWRDYKDDHLQIVVDCHFNIKPTGNEYWDNRQTMLEAIYRAAEKTGVKFERLVVA